MAGFAARIIAGFQIADTVADHDGIFSVHIREMLPDISNDILLLVSDVVHICTPHYLHVDMAVEALERDINVVKNISSKEYGISHSQHDAYFNLLNRWEYEGKI